MDHSSIQKSHRSCLARVLSTHQYMPLVVKKIESYRVSSNYLKDPYLGRYPRTGALCEYLLRSKKSTSSYLSLQQKTLYTKLVDNGKDRYYIQFHLPQGIQSNKYSVQ